MWWDDHVTSADEHVHTNAWIYFYNVGTAYVKGNKFAALFSFLFSESAFEKINRCDNSNWTLSSWHCLRWLYARNGNTCTSGYTHTHAETTSCHNQKMSKISSTVVCAHMFSCLKACFVFDNRHWKTYSPLWFSLDKASSQSAQVRATRHKRQKKNSWTKLKTKKIFRDLNEFVTIKMQDIDKCLKDDETIEKSAKEIANGSCLFFF